MTAWDIFAKGITTDPDMYEDLKARTMRDGNLTVCKQRILGKVNEKLSEKSHESVFKKNYQRCSSGAYIVQLVQLLFQSDG